MSHEWSKPVKEDFTSTGTVLVHETIYTAEKYRIVILSTSCNGKHGTNILDSSINSR